MKKQVLKGDIGKFGKIVAGEKGYKKTLYGTILHVDYFGAVCLLGTEDIMSLFRKDVIDSFDEEEFIDKTI